VQDLLVHQAFHHLRLHLRGHRHCYHCHLLHHRLDLQHRHLLHHRLDFHRHHLLHHQLDLHHRHLLHRRRDHQVQDLLVHQAFHHLRLHLRGHRHCYHCHLLHHRLDLQHYHLLHHCLRSHPKCQVRCPPPSLVNFQVQYPRTGPL